MRQIRKERTHAGVKKSGKLLLALITVGLIFGSLYMFKPEIFQRSTKNTVVLEKHEVNLPLLDAPRTTEGKVVEFQPLPTTEIASTSIDEVDAIIKIMAWNSQMGLIYANGGIKTTKNSIFQKNGIDVIINRLDNISHMQNEMVDFVKHYKDDPNYNQGTNFIAIMGDAAAAWLSGVNPILTEYGDEYAAEIVFSCGRSLGEDQIMGPMEVKNDPQKARGMVLATVVRDGDWDIAIKWATDNDIPINTDESTYNPDALNFKNVSENTQASILYNTNYKETREVVEVVNGKTVMTGEKKEISIDMVGVWTPADVLVVEGKGGLVRIVSTKEYASQMPNVLIGIKKWNSDHPEKVKAIIRAISEGGDQVKSYEEALKEAGKMSAKVYGEQTGEYWSLYYKGTKKYDAMGNHVELGGSSVNNLADNAQLFGLNGSTNVYASVYKVFGDISSKLYPEDMPSYPPIEEVLNLRYLQEVVNENHKEYATADKIEYSNSDKITETISKRSYSIQFNTNEASFTPEAIDVLKDLHDQLTVASSLKITIEGHTDNSGSDVINIPLSQNRANAVKNWLMANYPDQYPHNRFAEVVGKGSSVPVDYNVNNNTVQNRTKNRRVEIELGY